MAANRNLLLRAIVLAAVRQQKATGQMPVEQLEGIVVGKFQTEFSDGKTLISTSENGGSASFTLAGAFTPDEVVALAMETIQRINQGDFGCDPNNLNPYLNFRRIKRLRVSFGKATV